MWGYRRGGGIIVNPEPSFCTRKALAAWVYKSAAPSSLSCFPPKKLNPPRADAACLSACVRVSNCRNGRGGTRDQPLPEEL